MAIQALPVLTPCLYIFVLSYLSLTRRKEARGDEGSHSGGRHLENHNFRGLPFQSVSDVTETAEEGERKERGRREEEGCRREEGGRGEARDVSGGDYKAINGARFM